MPDCERLARTGEQPQDWASDLAVTICADIAGLRHRDALELVAMRLRVVRREGFSEGFEDAASDIARRFAGLKATIAARRPGGC